MAPMSPDTACSMSLLQLLASKAARLSAIMACMAWHAFVGAATSRRGESVMLSRTHAIAAAHTVALFIQEDPRILCLPRRDKTSAFCSVSFHGHWPRIYRQATLHVMACIAVVLHSCISHCRAGLVWLCETRAGLGRD